MTAKDRLPSPLVATQAFQVVHGDCLPEMASIGDGSVDLAYLDPPFNTGKSHHAALGGYDDRFGTLEYYLAFMQPRLARIHRALAATGSILLHCDWRTSHHLRVMLDEVFGAENFVNHLIWSYGLGGSSPRRFARKHDDILFYSRSDCYYFDPPRTPASSQRMRGQMKKSTDVLAIPAINNMASERVGYPTQKPLALLTLLVRACSPPGGFVLDPFCGSGTTLVAALRLGRRCLGIDHNMNAVNVARARCQDEVTRVAGPSAAFTGADRCR